MTLVLLDIDCAWPETELGEALSTLPGPVQERAGRYRVSGARRNLIATQCSLRSVIRELGYSEDQLATCENGRPWLRDSELSFNLSHSESRAVLGLSLDPRLKQCLGVDVEWMNRRVERRSLAKRFFTPQESERVLADPGCREFFFIWTRKEAVLKSNGIGLRVPLNNFQVLRDEVAQEISGRPLRLQTCERPSDYLASWAVPAECVDIEVVWIESGEPDWLSRVVQALKPR